MLMKPCPVNYYKNGYYNDAEIGIINAHHNYVVGELEANGFSVVNGKIEYDSSIVAFNLKAINILQSDKAKQVFDKGVKNNWTLDRILSELQVPKEQKQLILNLGKTSREEIITDLLANYSYTIEINTAKVSESIQSIREIEPGLWNFRGEDFYSYSDAIDAKNEYNESRKETPTQHYSNLSAPGGTKGKNKYEDNPDWEYQEVEFHTPDITPNIKGHAQFSTDNGIGWARIWYNKKTGAVEVQEVQSDLFQKGRDLDDLVTKHSKSSLDHFSTLMSNLNRKLDKGEISLADYRKERQILEDNQKLGDKFKNLPDNQFLQLLNKDNNWVTFFIKSIIQDSAKKGYEKVLFPRLDTIIQIESAGRFKTYEEAEKYYKNEAWQKNNDRILKELSILKDWKREDFKNYVVDNLEIKGGRFFHFETLISKESFDELLNTKLISKKEELAANQPSLLNTAKFYENDITNILNKTYGKENVNLITDEYGNTWNEVTINPLVEPINNKVEQTISTLTKINNQYKANVATIATDGSIEVDMSIVADELIGNNTIQLSKPNNRLITSPETINSFDRKLEILKKAIPSVEVILDTTINNKGQVAIENGKKVIRINPNNFTSDTLVHEFGHLYIDILIADGYSSMIQNGINQLKGTELWNETASLYPELNDVDLGKEVLATAIGLESTELADKLNPTVLNKILSILDSIYKALKRLLGIDYNIARELAKQLITNKVLSNDVSLILTFEQQNSKKTQEDAKRLLNAHAVSKENVNNKNIYSVTLKDGTVIKSSQSMTEWIKAGKDFEASEAARFAAIRNLMIPNGVVITEEMNRMIDDEAQRIQDSWYTGSAIGTNIHKLFEDIFEKDAVLSDISEYFSSNIQGLEVNKELLKEFETNFYKLVEVARNIKRRHPGAVFYTEYKIVDLTSTNPIAGTIDLLVVNPDGTLSIYDFKTSVNEVYETVNGTQKLTQGYVNNVFEKHAKQLFGYAAILNKNFGLQTVDFNIVPVHIDMSYLGEYKGIVTSVGPQPFIEVNSFVASRAIRQAVNAEFKVEPAFKLNDDESIAVVNAYIKKKVNDTELFIKSTLENRTAQIDVKSLNKIANDLVNIEGLDGILTNIKHLKELYEQLRKDYRDALTASFLISNQLGKNYPIPTKQKVEFLNTLHYLEVMAATTIETVNLADVSSDELNIGEHVVSPLNSIAGDVQNFKAVIHKEILETLAEKLVAETDIGKQQFKKKYGLEFAELNKMQSTFGLADTYYIGNVKVSRESWVNARQKYIETKFKENEEEIYNFSMSVANKYVTNVPFDIPAEYVAMEIGEFNNYIIKYVNNKLRDLDIERQQGFLEKRNELVDRLTEIGKTTDLGQLTNPEKIFGKYIEGDHLVTRYKDSFLYGEDGYYNMLKAQKEYTKKIREAIANKLDTVTALEKEKEAAKLAWMKENTIKVRDNSGKNRVFPSAKHANPKFDAIKDDPMYQLLLEMVISSDALLVDNRLKLTNNTFNTSFIKLPSLSKGTIEAMQSGGYLNKLKQAIQVNPEDTDFRLQPPNVIDESNILNELDLLERVNSEHFEKTQAVNVNVEGKAVPNINFGYRGYIGNNREEHINNISKDLIASLLANYNTSLNYNLKAQFKDEFSIVVEALNNSKISGTTQRGNSAKTSIFDTLKNLTGLTKAVTINEQGEETDRFVPNVNTRWSKALNGLIEQKLLGIKLTGSATGHRIANTANTLAAVHTLSFNQVSSIANYAAGLHSLFMESGIGNIITFGSMKKAVAASLAENPMELLDSINSVRPTTKNGALSEKFNIRSQTVNPEYHLLQKSKVFRMFGFKLLNILNDVVEANISNIALKAILYNTKLVNKDGNYVNANREVVNDPNDAIDYYTAVGFKDGELIYPTDLYIAGNKSPLNSLEAQKKLQKTISYVMFKTQGYYQSDAVVAAKRDAIGKLLLSMKNWLVPYINNRYRYVSHLFNHNLEYLDTIGYINYNEDGTSDIGIETQYFDHIRNSYRSHYTANEHQSAIKRMLLSTVKTMFDNTDNFNKLDYDARRKIIIANRNTMFMMLTSIMTSLLGMLILQSYDDDEKEEIIKNEYKAIKKNISNAKARIAKTNDKNEIKELNKNIEEWERLLKDGIPDHVIPSLYFNDSVPKKIANVNPDKYFKDVNNKYYAKSLNITSKEIKLIGVPMFTGNKPLVSINSDRASWDLVFAGAVLLNRIKDESQQFSILSTSTAIVEGPRALLSPAESALKIIQSPSAALSLVPAILRFTDNVFGVFSNSPDDVHQENQRSTEFPSVYDNIKYTEKDKMLKSILKYGKETNYEKLYETIYAKGERLKTK